MVKEKLVRYLAGFFVLSLFCSDVQVIAQANISAGAQSKADAGGGASGLVIPGYISEESQNSPVARVINRLIDKHCESSPEYQAITKEVNHYRKRVQRVVSAAKDSLDFSFHVKGLGPSSTTAQLLLDEDFKIKDLASAEYRRQVYVDQVHRKVVAAMMHICESKGCSDSGQRQQLLSEGTIELEKVVGRADAVEIVRALNKLLAAAPVSANVFDQKPWGSLERNRRLDELVKTSISKDPTVLEIRKRVSRHAHAGIFKTLASQVIDTTLSIVSYGAPGYVIPWSAEGLLNAYVMVTGGSEEDKIEKEIFLYKRIQSRLSVLNDEASLALDNYRFALLTRNRPLLTFSAAVIEDMKSGSLANLATAGESRTDGRGLPQLVPRIGVVDLEKTEEKNAGESRPGDRAQALSLDGLPLHSETPQTTAADPLSTHPQSIEPVPTDPVSTDREPAPAQSLK